MASSIAWTGSARQLITVESDSYKTTTAVVAAWQRTGPCWTLAGGPWAGHIGENLFSDHHLEGDGTTPTGIYRIGPTIYGNTPNPGVKEDYHRLVCGDWWDPDPAQQATTASSNSPADSSHPSRPPARRCGRKPPLIPVSPSSTTTAIR